MPYRSVVEVPASLKRTILGTFDFRGRSTRTEVFIYAIISQIAANLSAFVVLALLLPDGDFDDRQQIQDGMVLLWNLPAFALLARRLHDQDRSGWWSLVLLTAIVGAVMSGGGSLNSLRPLPVSNRPGWPVLFSSVRSWRCGLFRCGHPRGGQSLRTQSATG